MERTVSGDEDCWGSGKVQDESISSCRYCRKSRAIIFGSLLQSPITFCLLPSIAKKPSSFLVYSAIPNLD